MSDTVFQRTGILRIVPILLLVLSGCSGMDRLPVSNYSSPKNRKKAVEPTDEDSGGESSLVSSRELETMVNALFTDCPKHEIVPREKRELLLGYEGGANRPTCFGSLSRVGDASGNLVVGVSVAKNADGAIEIASVATTEISGDLKGKGQYNRSRAEFLRQFEGQPVNGSIGEVDAITGATPISTKLGEVIREEAQHLARLMETETWPERTSGSSSVKPVSSGGRGPSSNEGAQHPSNSSVKITRWCNHLMENIALLSELFLFGALVALLIWNKLSVRKG